MRHGAFFTRPYGIIGIFFNFLFTFLITLGVFKIIKIVFGIDIPIAGIVPGIFIPLWISYRAGAPVREPENLNLYTRGFGDSRIIDLRHIKPSDTPRNITTNALLSKVMVKVDPYTPIEIKVNMGLLVMLPYPM